MVLLCGSARLQGMGIGLRQFLVARGGALRGGARVMALGEFDERSVIQRTIDVYERLLGTDMPGGSLAAS